MVKRQDELDFMTFGGQRVSARSMRNVSAAFLHAALTLTSSHLASVGCAASTGTAH